MVNGKDVIDLDEGEYWRELTGWANAWADDFTCKISHLCSHAGHEMSLEVSFILMKCCQHTRPVF